MANKPPLFKEILVGLLVGGLFGPVIGWFIGTFAALFAVAAMDTENVRTIRGSGFIGGLIGIALGFATGPVSSLPMRLISTRGPGFLKNFWVATAAGAVIGALLASLILHNWYPTFGSLLYIVMVCTIVGGITAGVAVIAKPKWLQ